MKIAIMFEIKINRLILLLFLLCDSAMNLCHCIPSAIPGKSWPRMKTFKIWDSETDDYLKSEQNIISVLPNGSGNSTEINDSDMELYVNDYPKRANERDSRVLNFFPIPVDDECLSDDGRRYGVCLNVYECRIQGGTSRGECALGFGVCCVFVSSCGQEVANNLTYIISPNFPALMSSDLKSCKLKIKLLSPDVSQLRFDFLHFSLGQPNRKNGICDGDIFELTGGIGGPFQICGHNSGQHVYYDVTNLAREEQMGDIELNMNFSSGFVSSRLWEIRVTQILFSQRAPAGCMQYFTEPQGVIQTFNFAENGRHLANQNYRVCIRQETGMCSIGYEPCNDQSFRIGGANQALGSMAGPQGSMMPIMPAADEMMPIQMDPMSSSPETLMSESSSVPMSSSPDPTSTTARATTGASTTGSTTVATSTAGSTAAASSTAAPSSTTAAPSNDEVEGSGDDGNSAGAPSVPSGITGFFSSLTNFLSRDFVDTFAIRRSARQYFPSTCIDRITLPCVVEDFIAAGPNVPPPRCVPVHCGNSLCGMGNGIPCKIESTVTPFSIGVHFGDGTNKGSPEDNIGACIRYNQVACV